MSPVSNWPPVAVSVWVTESLLATVTVDPGATEAAMGSNMKFEMVTVCVVVAPAALRDGDDVVGADDPAPAGSALGDPSPS